MRRRHQAVCGTSRHPGRFSAPALEEHAGADVEQAVLACYVAMFLLRKRLIRGDRLQTFADTYATALRVRDLIFAACYADSQSAAGATSRTRRSARQTAI